MANTKPARGMRDFLPSDVRKRNYVIGIIKEVYESYGFEPLETPAVENIETLTGKYGEEGNQLIFKILKRGEKLDLNADEKDLADLALRYDLTVPLARVVANHKNDLPKFFKRYQIQPVWRADRPARGRFREFYQCDVDAIGSSSMIVEAELCAAVSEILTRLEFSSFAIHINNRKILTAILDSSGIPFNKHTDALIALDKIEKIGPEKFQEELLERGVEKQNIEKFGQFMAIIYAQMNESLNSNDIKTRKLFNETVIETISNFIGEHKEGRSGLKELKEIFDYTGNNKHSFIDVALARGLSYYTGTIIEITLVDENFKTDSDFAVSIGGGGRYDGLIGMFGKEQIPACGFSLGLERILVVMEERGIFQKLIDEGKLKLDSADVLVTVWNETSISESLKFAAELRCENLRVLVYPEADKLGKQFKYADSIKIPFVCVLGESELAENKVTLKNLRTGEQETIARDKASEKIKI